MNDVRAITPPVYTLSEGPVWDSARHRLSWVDISEGSVLSAKWHEGSVGPVSREAFDSDVGAVALTADGSLLVAESRSLTHVAVDGTRTTIETGAAVPCGDRFNDAVCDRRGRLLIGTLSVAGKHRDQRLLRVTEGRVEVLDDDLGLSNGLAFSPDGSVLYNVDSVPGLVWQRPYDADAGTIGERKLWMDMSDYTPDGMTVDAAGRLWIALWGRGEVHCYEPDGQLNDVITVPAPHTTSVAFIGDKLDVLAITTARSELTDAQLLEFPSSGSIFVTEPGAVGLEPDHWSGLRYSPSTHRQS